LSNLCAEALMLLTTGRMGVPCLCSFICAISFGACGLFCMRNLACFFTYDHVALFEAFFDVFFGICW
jgi:hypothetical protein